MCCDANNNYASCGNVDCVAGTECYVLSTSGIDQIECGGYGGGGPSMLIGLKGNDSTGKLEKANTANEVEVLGQSGHVGKKFHRQKLATQPGSR
jgi:hypothetical protein